MKKKIISFVLVMAMLLSVLPASVFATAATQPAQDITVYLTVIDKGEIAVSNTATGNKKMVSMPVVVSDIDKDGKISYHEALQKAHDIYCAGGYSAAQGFYFSVSKLWNDVTGNFYFYHDGDTFGTGVNEEYLEQGDNITAVILHSLDAYVYYDTEEAVLDLSDNLTLQMIDGPDMAGTAWSNLDLSSLFSTAETYVNGVKVATSTNLGKVTIDKSNFQTTGEYYVTSKLATSTDIIPPVCKVTVVDEIPFKVTATDTDIPLNVIRVEENAYRSMNMNGTYDIVDLYTVDVKDLSKVKLSFSENRITYNYKLDGTYISGYYADWGMAGELSSIREIDSAPTDGTADGFADCIQVQKTYGDSSEPGKLLYAVTFKSTNSVKNGKPQPVKNSQPVVEIDLIDNYAKTLSAKTIPTDWDIVSLMSYEKLYDGNSLNKLSDDAVQKYVDSAIATIAKSDASEGDIAKAIIGLSSLGYDVTKLYPVNSNDAINAIDKLNRCSHSGSYYIYTAPYVLVAYAQGDYGTAAETNANTVLNYVLGQQADGWWIDADGTGPILQALAFYKNKAGVATAIDNAVNAIKENMSDEGLLGYSFGGTVTYNANSTALVIAGLAACGVDPSLIVHTNAQVATPTNLVDGLKSFAHYNDSLFDYDGFGYIDNTAINDYENQSFRGLIAYVLGENTAWYDSTAPYAKHYSGSNILDFSASSKTAARALNKPSETVIDEPNSDVDITVWITIKGQSSYILNSYAVTVPSDASAAYAFAKACNAKGISFSNATGNYISQIAGLSEFDGGPNSGWLYKKNGVLPNYGVAQCSLANGDNLLFYYTNDWTEDPDASTFMYETKKETTKSAIEAPFTDIAKTDWFYDYVQKAYQLKLFGGVDDTHFAPTMTFSRGMLATVLFRHAGTPKVAAAKGFSDVASGTWYSDGASWAQVEGIFDGYPDGRFDPDGAITREQMALVLMRYSQYLKLDVSKLSTLEGFNDVNSISDWALVAMKWANAAGIIEGSGYTLNPTGASSRAEAATMLVRFIEKYLK